MKGARELPPLLLSTPSSESDEKGRRIVAEDPPRTWSVSSNNGKKRLSKQLSMRETTREAAWEKRRQQILQKQRRRMPQLLVPTSTDDECCEEEEEEDSDCYTPANRLLTRTKSLTDEDLHELRGSIDLGFGFSEEDGGHDLCHTLPALDLYFAVTRQLSSPRIFSSPSPASTPTTIGGGSSSSLIDSPSPRSPNYPHAAANATAADLPPWKICSPGDNPQHVKTRLRHWAQAVACSVLLKEWDGGAGAAAAGDE
ncbi:hypothetical protein Taro_037213 [Colocasia esculenta]|uniref:Uncharacterized protein n=1 Tax=Colocasia esculenta TaxID=4460 RepID=A0A843W3J7_COLES|nr:hypothetical protein [Colocasia esculenta]